MKRLIVGILLFFCCTGLAFAESAKSLVRVEGLSRSEVRAIGVSGFDVPKAGKNFVEVVVTPQEKAGFAKPGRTIKVLIPDLNAYVASRLKTPTKGPKYFTYETMTTQLQAWAKKYDKIARLSSVGKSCEGRDIWAMKVSDNPEVDQKKPAALIMGAHHAREWISFEVPMEALRQYLEGYGADPKITQLVNEREVWFIPMVNPDGVIYSQTKSQYWRKNRRNNGDKSFGVDLNRNYGYHWGMTGTSNNGSSDTYHGKKAYSEPETTAIRDLCEKEHFQASISFHSYSELVLFPFGYDYNLPNPDEATFKKLAGEMAEFNKYTPENSAELYPVMGDSDDYGYGENKTLAFTFELAQTFIPDPTEIEGINQLNVPAVFHLIDKAGTYAVSTPTGSKIVAQNLKFQTALDALKDGENMLPGYSSDARVQAADQLMVIENRVADLVSADLIRGNTESWAKVKALPHAGEVQKLIKDRLVFASVHENLVPPEILLEIRKMR